jgi:hypothetical protein
MHGTAGYVSPIFSAGPMHMHERYVRCCEAVSRANQHAPPTLSEWAARFAAMRREVTEADARSPEVRVCDLHCLAATLFALVGEERLVRSPPCVQLIAALLTAELGATSKYVALAKRLQLKSVT